MKLRFKLNQAAAFRAGINAPTSIVDLEVDPATINESDRQLIADRLNGIEVRVLRPCNPNTYPTAYKADTYTTTDIIVATQPDLQGLLAAVHQDNLTLQKEQTENKRRYDQDQQTKDSEAKEISELIVKGAKLTHSGGWTKVEDRIIHDASLLSPEANSILDAYYQQYREEQARQEEEKALQQELAKQEAAAARSREIECMTPFLNEQERNLLTRKRLSMDDVRTRLTNEAVMKLWNDFHIQWKTPEGKHLFADFERYDLHSTHCDSYKFDGHHTYEHTTWSTQEMAIVTVIEGVTKHPVVSIYHYNESTALAFNTHITVAWSPIPIPVSIHIVEPAQEEEEAD